MPTRSAAIQAALAISVAGAAHAEKTHFTYLWHLEQPIYWPDDNGGQ